MERSNGPLTVRVIDLEGGVGKSLDLKDLGERAPGEFLFTWAPLKLAGATGSPGNPVAAW